MSNAYAIFLWLLKLGALVNLYFLARTLALPPGAVDPGIVLPAQIFFVVSAYRCLFPNRYEGNIVLHASPLSSTLVTRTLATFAEVAWIDLIAHVIRMLNVEQIVWVDVFSWLMVLQIVASQLCVWGAIVTDRPLLYFYEEFGWVVIFVLSTIASTYLYLTVQPLGSGRTLLQLNLSFALVYLPWQVVNLRALWARVRGGREAGAKGPPVTRHLVASGLRRALREYRRATDAESWGGLLGLTWMAGYWATLVPMWLSSIVELAQGCGR
jgi:hypothetical protein